MNEPRLYGYDGGGQEPPTPAGSSPAAPYKFSPDELRVLKECNNESFIQRSLPLGTLLGLGAFFGVQNGHFKPNPRFGAFPKVTLAVIMGYFLGKMSYQQACAEKLMALPGSYIGQLLRERKEGKFDGVSRQQAPSTMFGASPGDIYSDAGPGSSLDLDTDRPLFTEDVFVPNSDLSVNPSQPEAAPRSVLSYDELRRRNRGEYNDTRQEPYKLEPSTAPVVTRAPAARPAAPAAPAATNKYGDAME
ncbi:OCIA domain-containing protein 1 [Zerene cesonia]|uniref:OCIA domain-containing protein 1 n=1 Tax=Zerene cesonia TaxID=33412 RepID=UPI0018E54126|nr:OCIA domain-containing protein 1 [Zerene cesonia]